MTVLAGKFEVPLPAWPSAMVSPSVVSCCASGKSKRAAKPRPTCALIW
jgi:hypothetical protein